MVIEELILNEEDENAGVFFVSFVTTPATKVIGGEFEYFADEEKKQPKRYTPEKGPDYRKEMYDVEGKYSPTMQIPLWYKYTANPAQELVDNSHKFCEDHAGKYLHITQIRDFGKYSDLKAYELGFIYDPDSKEQIGKEYFTNFMSQPQKQDYQVHNAIFNCRHRLSAVRSQDEYVKNIKGKIKFEEDVFFSSDDTMISVDIKLAIDNVEKREVVGDIFIADKLIYRKRIPGTNGDGYVWMSKETIKKLFNKFGYSNKITLQHEEDITGSAIMLDTWLVDDGAKWKAKYKIVSDKLWDLIKTNHIGGFSIESKMAILKK